MRSLLFFVRLFFFLQIERHTSYTWPISVGCCIIACEVSNKQFLNIICSNLYILTEWGMHTDQVAYYNLKCPGCNPVQLSLGCPCLVVISDAACANTAGIGWAVCVATTLNRSCWMLRSGGPVETSTSWRRNLFSLVRPVQWNKEKLNYLPVFIYLFIFH